MNTTAPQETEIKIPVDELSSIRSRLAGSDAKCRQAMSREHNTLFDTPDKRLSSRGHTFRLRRFAGRAIVTHKGAISYVGQIKRRDELEVQVDDPETFEKILTALGFAASIRYEKDREEWCEGNLLVTLDHTPMGDFVEIEGPLEEIPVMADSLGLDLDRGLRGSYISLWLEYRQQHPDRGLARDMLFTE